ncbi:MAG: hypothetical protein A2743_03145 [Candidatus Taylorbacteria bacterium RIFCSPHIGHO2_01_FULL_43_47]|nr:MAG: hypothetical protein A2743_03145 [Candidatus Taylorbacteria bacterium RIFCSPHIGHO2_01_FULL_43_47]
MISIQLISIILEAVIVVAALAIGLKKGRLYGYGLSLTFGIYVYYDLVRYMEWSSSSSLLSYLFLTATVSALLSIWSLYHHS